MSPQVYQGLNILAMPVAELQAMIEQELLENPVLEVDSLDEAPEDEAEEERVDEGTEEERAWDEWLDQYEDLDEREPVVPRDPNEEAVNTEEFVGAIVSFEAYLLEQLALLDIDDEVEHAARVGRRLARRRRAARGLGRGDRGGRGREPGGRRAGHRGRPAARPARAWARADLAEALKIQMRSLDIDEPLLERIIDEHLADVAANHYRKIARAIHVGRGRRSVGSWAS